MEWLTVGYLVGLVSGAVLMLAVEEIKKWWKIRQYRQRLLVRFANGEKQAGAWLKALDDGTGVFHTTVEFMER